MKDTRHITPAEVEALADKIGAVCAEYGFNQFVVAIHNCQQETVLTIQSKKRCGLMMKMYDALEIVKKVLGGVSIGSHFSSN